MNDFDRHISLIRALKRLQPNHKKIYSIYCQFGDMMGQDGKHLFDELTVLKTEMNK